MRVALRVAAMAGGLGLLACTGSGEGIPDEQLAGLVHEQRNEPAPIDVDRATTDPAELARALAQPHRQVAEALGAHLFTGTSSVEVEEGGAVVESLSDETRLAYLADGSFAGHTKNSAGYGREAIFTGGTLYLRPGYGKYHRRPPTEAGEPARIRDELFGTLAAQFELLAPAVELSDKGTEQRGGRAARKIELRTAQTPAPRPIETAPQRSWRQHATVSDVKGLVWLDAETGAALEAELSGVVAFNRDGRSFQMKLASNHRITDIGAAPEVEAPPAEETVATPERSRELDEREQLLRGIAPPAQRGRTPSNPTGITGPATGD